MSEPPYSILDASAAIVLFASGDIESILAAWPRRIGMVEETLAEVLFLRDRGAADRKGTVERISFDSLVESGTVSVFKLQSIAEYASFVRFARMLDDGEAAAAAVAIERGFELVIDERKAHSVLRGQATMCWSLELVWHWLHTTSAQEDKTRATLRNIRQKASYLPHRTHPLRDWWNTHVPEI